MVRTDPDLVAGIIEVDEDIDLEPFIQAASILVDRVAAVADSKDLLLPATDDDPDREEVLTQIETWLAAHFYTVRDPREEEEQAGTVRARYQGRQDLRLFTSHYGQMAVTLDSTGTLELINKGKGGTAGRPIGVTWVGKAAEE